MPTITPPDQEHQTAPHTVENPVAATRGEPLAIRVQKRKADLESALLRLPREDLRVRAEIALALSSLGHVPTRNHEHLPPVTATALYRWLQRTTHLAEHAAMPPKLPQDIGEP